MRGEITPTGEAEEVVGDDVIELVEALARANVVDKRGVEDTGPALVELEDLPLFLEEIGVVILRWVREDRGGEKERDLLGTNLALLVAEILPQVRRPW